MPLSVESMLSEWTTVAIYLMFTLAINTLEWVSTRFFFLSFKSRRICFKVGLITPCYLSVMLDFMITVAFGAICMTSKSGMIPLLTILVLRNIRVHIGSLDSCNLLTYIETSVNRTLCFCTILRIPNIDPYNNYIWLRRQSDNMWMRS